MISSAFVGKVPIFKSFYLSKKPR